MQHQHGLLVDALDCDEAHGRPRHGLGDGFGVSSVGLPALDVGLHVRGRHQLHGVAELGQLARPVMRRAARLHADKARRELGEEGEDLGPAQRPAHDHLALIVDAVDLEHVLRQIEADGANHVSWTVPVDGGLNDRILAHRCR